MKTAELNKLISEYSDCGMQRELEGTTSFEMAVRCRYEENGKTLCCKHQCRVRKDALNQMFNILKHKKSRLSTAGNFEELLGIVCEGKVDYIGDLTKYDIAMRIGYTLSPKVLPQEFVYIHRGTEKGAKALYKLGFLSKRPSSKMEIRDFVALESLKKQNKFKEATFAMLVEDFLCVKHEELEKLAK